MAWHEMTEQWAALSSGERPLIWISKLAARLVSQLAAQDALYAWKRRARLAWEKFWKVHPVVERRIEGVKCFVECVVEFTQSAIPKSRRRPRLVSPKKSL